MTKQKDIFLMSIAIENAKKASKKDEVPVGAILVKDDKIIANGYNQVIQLNDCTAHAEVMTLRNAGNAINNYRLINTTLYVTLEPCMMCVGAMIHARISTIVFGAYDKKTGMAGTKDNCFNKPYHNHKVSIIGGVMEEECAQLLKDFFRLKRSV